MSDTTPTLPARQPDAPPPDAAENTAAQVPVLQDRYKGASQLALTAGEVAVLRADVPDEEIRIREDGIVYLPGEYYRRTLLDALGVGGWALVPMSKYGYDEEYEEAYYDGALYIRGVFVARAMGGKKWRKKNKRMSRGDAVEAAKTDCLRRCCKDLGIGLDLWNKVRVAEWRDANTETRPAQNKYDGDGKLVWKVKGEPWPDNDTLDGAGRPARTATSSRPVAPAPSPPPTAPPPQAPPAAPLPVDSSVGMCFVEETANHVVFDGVMVYYDTGKSIRVGYPGLGEGKEFDQYKAYIAKSTIDKKRTTLHGLTREEQAVVGEIGRLSFATKALEGKGPFEALYKAGATPTPAAPQMPPATPPPAATATAQAVGGVVVECPSCGNTADNVMCGNDIFRCGNAQCGIRFEVDDSPF